MKTKVLLLLGMLLMFVCPLFAQTGDANTDLGIGNEAFTAIVSVISLVVTQIAKQVYYIQNHNWLKILISVVVGILICAISKVINWPIDLVDMSWVQTVLLGAIAGLSGSGIYDLIKSFFKTNKEE